MHAPFHSFEEGLVIFGLAGLAGLLILWLGVASRNVLGALVGLLLGAMLFADKVLGINHPLGVPDDLASIGFIIVILVMIRQSRGSRRTEAKDEPREVAQQDLERMFAVMKKMEQRIENLETILLSRK